MDQHNFPASYLNYSYERAAWETIKTLVPIASIEATLTDHMELTQSLGFVSFNEALSAINQTNLLVRDRSYANVALEATDSIATIAKEYSDMIGECVESFNASIDTIEQIITPIDDSSEYAFVAQVIYNAATNVVNTSVYVANYVDTQVQEIESETCWCDGKGHLVAIIRSYQATNLLLEALTIILSSARIVRFLANSFRIPGDGHRVGYESVMRDMQIKVNLPSIWEIHEEIAMKLFHPARVEKFLEICEDPLEYLA